MHPVGRALKGTFKRLARACGLDVRRAPDPRLPFIHDIRVLGIPFRLWIANEHALAWWGGDAVSPSAEFDFLGRCLGPGATYIDVGAHHGIMVMPAALRVGVGGSVHAFEANASNALVLAANVGLNGLGNCRLHHAAVAARSGVLRMGGESVGRDAKGGVEVRAIDLDAYVVEAGLDRIDLLKIDVEGFEAGVLEGAQGIWPRVRNVNLELHIDDVPRYGASVSRVLELAHAVDFDIGLLDRARSWTDVTAWQHGDPLPGSGVVNLLMSRRGAVPPGFLPPARPG